MHQTDIHVYYFVGFINAVIKYITKSILIYKCLFWIALYDGGD